MFLRARAARHQLAGRYTFTIAEEARADPGAAYFDGRRLIPFSCRVNRLVTASSPANPILGSLHCEREPAP